MSKYLILSSKLPHIKPKVYAWVITSSENIKLIGEKERQKLQIVLEKEGRKVIKGAKEVPETATKESSPKVST